MQAIFDVAPGAPVPRRVGDLFKTELRSAVVASGSWLFEGLMTSGRRVAVGTFLGQLRGLLVYSAVDPEAGTEERRKGNVGKGELSQLDNL